MLEYYERGEARTVELIPDEVTEPPWERRIVTTRAPLTPAPLRPPPLSVRELARDLRPSRLATLATLATMTARMASVSTHAWPYSQFLVTYRNHYVIVRVWVLNLQHNCCVGGKEESSWVELGIFSVLCFLHVDLSRSFVNTRKVILKKVKPALSGHETNAREDTKYCVSQLA